MITISVFGWVPEPVRGLVRDLRVRWALEEVGLEYQEHILDVRAKGIPAYTDYKRDWQPFAQVPAYREGDLTLFESGAIVHHIAGKSPVLMSKDGAMAARTVSWMFAALNSIEAPLQELVVMDIFHGAEEWSAGRRALAETQARARLQDLSDNLDGREYLVGQFSAADILMATVLRIPRHCGIVGEYPVLAAYLARCEARPAFERALAAHLATFERFADN